MILAFVAGVTGVGAFAVCARCTCARGRTKAFLACLLLRETPYGRYFVS